MLRRYYHYGTLDSGLWIPRTWDWILGRDPSLPRKSRAVSINTANSTSRSDSYLLPPLAGTGHTGTRRPRPLPFSSHARGSRNGGRARDQRPETNKTKDQKTRRNGATNQRWNETKQED
jgi:hypothetical protein